MEALLGETERDWFRFISNDRPAEDNANDGSSFFRKVLERHQTVHPIMSRATALPSIPFMSRPQTATHMINKQKKLTLAEYLDSLPLVTVLRADREVYAENVSLLASRSQRVSTRVPRLRLQQQLPQHSSRQSRSSDILTTPAVSASAAGLSPLFIVASETLFVAFTRTSTHPPSRLNDKLDSPDTSMNAAINESTSSLSTRDTNTIASTATVKCHKMQLGLVPGSGIALRLKAPIQHYAIEKLLNIDSLDYVRIGDSSVAEILPSMTVEELINLADRGGSVMPSLLQHTASVASEGGQSDNSGTEDGVLRKLKGAISKVCGVENSCSLRQEQRPVTKPVAVSEVEPDSEPPKYSLVKPPTLLTGRNMEKARQSRYGWNSGTSEEEAEEREASVFNSFTSKKRYGYDSLSGQQVEEAENGPRFLRRLRSAATLWRLQRSTTSGFGGGDSGWSSLRNRLSSSPLVTWCTPELVELLCAARQQQKQEMEDVLAAISPLNLSHSTTTPCTYARATTVTPSRGRMLCRALCLFFKSHQWPLVLICEDSDQSATVLQMLTLAVLYKHGVFLPVEAVGAVEEHLRAGAITQQSAVGGFSLGDEKSPFHRVPTGRWGRRSSSTNNINKFSLRGFHSP